MKNIKFTHDWFAFDYKGKHYEFGYRFSEADLDGYGNERNFLKKASARDIIKEYEGDKDRLIKFTNQCDFCNSRGNWKNVLRDQTIQKKDGSDLILCGDCINLYVNKEYQKLNERIEEKGKVIIASTPKGNSTFEKELKKYKIDNNLKLKDNNILLFKNKGEFYILIKLKDFERILEGGKNESFLYGYNNTKR